MKPSIFAALIVLSIASAEAATQSSVAIVLKDQVALRPAARDSASPHALLGQGEIIEVRGERLEYLQVYDYRRERAGYVRASDARRLTLGEGETSELGTIVRFLRDMPGNEALGIGYAAAFIQAAPAATMNSATGIDMLDALGTMADRLAQRASSGAQRSVAAQAALSAQMETAVRHGVAFNNFEREGRVQICYDGDAFRRVLALPATPSQQARAALALTRLECTGHEASPLERKRINEWRAEIIERVKLEELPGYEKNRVLARRAALWSGLAFQRARLGEDSASAAKNAMRALSGLNKTELSESDQRTYADAAMRSNASRWAGASAVAASKRSLQVVTQTGQPGETCVMLVDKSNDTMHPLAKRCTYGLVWTASASVNREGSALTLAVQTSESWRELWLFRKLAGAWTLRVLPPATTMPDVGYAEFAGWVPGGKQMLVAREASGEGKYRKMFEVVNLDSLTVFRQASDPNLLSAFRRWQDAAWKTQTVSLR